MLSTLSRRAGIEHMILCFGGETNCVEEGLAAGGGSSGAVKNTVVWLRWDVCRGFSVA